MKLETRSSIEEIFQGLEEEGEKEKKKIIAEAEEEASQILREAERKAKDTYDSIIAEKKSIISGEVAKIIREAEQEAERKLADVKVRFVNLVFDSALQEILKLRKTEKYAISLRNLLQECLAEIGSVTTSDSLNEDALADALLRIFGEKITRQEALVAARSVLQNREENSSLLELIRKEVEKNMPSIVIRCAPDDEPVIRKILEEEGIKGKVITDNSIDGGIVVTSADGKITVNNTFSSRVNKLKRLYTKELVEKFFSKT